MSTINSDLSGARQKATALKSATDSLSQSIVATTDTQTTVLGNAEALKTITSAQITAKAIASAVSLAAANIQTVAENFDAMDNQAAQALRGNIGDLF